MTNDDLVDLARKVLTPRQFQAWKISETLLDDRGQPAGKYRVAYLLDCSPETARDLLRKARRKLAQAMLEHDKEAA